MRAAALAVLLAGLATAAQARDLVPDVDLRSLDLHALGQSLSPPDPTPPPPPDRTLEGLHPPAASGPDPLALPGPGGTTLAPDDPCCLGKPDGLFIPGPALHKSF